MLPKVYYFFTTADERNTKTLILALGAMHNQELPIKCFTKEKMNRLHSIITHGNRILGCLRHLFRVNWDTRL